MDIKCETLKKCVVEMDAILTEYFEKTEASEGVPKLDMDWDFYAEMEKQDKLIIITARNDEMLGFNMYQVVAHPHHKTVMFGFCDILAVRLGHRHKGIGKQLVLAGESMLRLYNVKRVIHGFRAVYASKPLFARMGYELMDANYVKVL